MHADVRNGVLPVTPCSFHWDQDNVSAGVHPHSQYHKTCYVIPLSATVACSLCASMSHAQRQVVLPPIFPLSSLKPAAAMHEIWLTLRLYGSSSILSVLGLVLSRRWITESPLASQSCTTTGSSVQMVA